MVAQHLQSLRKIAAPCVAPIHNELDRPFSDLPIVLRSDCLQSAQILGVQGPSPVVAGEQLHRDEVPDRCDGQHESGDDSKLVRGGNDFRLDTARSEQQIDHHPRTLILRSCASRSIMKNEAS